jgi:hypothetical protein
MKKLLFLVPLISLSILSAADQVDQDSTQEVQVIRTTGSPQTYSRPYYTNYAPQYYNTSRSSPPGSFRENTSQDAWHNKPNKDSYYDDPNWPNIKR